MGNIDHLAFKTDGHEPLFFRFSERFHQALGTLLQRNGIQFQDPLEDGADWNPESGLSKLEREMIAVVVSAINKCFYCLSAHGAAVRELSGDPKLGEMLVMNWRVADLEYRHRAMLAFVENQGELRKLQAEPGLLKDAVEECVRWATPIIHFAREATCDYELRGKKIKKGDALALFYPSANRDEDVFTDPFDFRIDRNPNRHLSFGIGEHFCVGSHLARMEMIVAYRHIIPRLEEVELTGPPERLWSSLVGGVKHLPIRYKVSAA